MSISGDQPVGPPPTNPASGFQVSLTDENSNTQILYSKTGGSTGSGFQPAKDSLRADQHAATKQVQSKFDTGDPDADLEAITASIRAKYEARGLRDVYEQKGRARSMGISRRPVADGQASSPPGGLEADTHSAAGSKATSRSDMPVTDPARPKAAASGSASTKLATSAGGGMPQVSNRIQDALGGLEAGGIATCFDRFAILRLASDLQKNRDADLGMPINEIFHTIAINTKTNAVEIDKGREDSMSLTFGVKDGKLFMRIDKAKKQKSEQEAALTNALAEQNITATFNNGGKGAGRVLTFEHSQNVASVDFTKQGIVLTRK